MRKTRATGLLTALSTGAAACVAVLGPAGLPAAQAATSPGFEISYQAPSTRLVEVSPTGRINVTASAMAEQTSTSLVTLPDGSFDEAFQASDGTMWFQNSVTGGHEVVQPTCGDTPFVLDPGTSPALAVDRQGVADFVFSEFGDEVSIQNPLINESCGMSGGVALTGSGMAVAALNVGPSEGGFIFVESWVSNHGFVQVREPGKGNHNAGDGVKAAPGTSPSVAAGPNGTWKLAYQGTDGRLWTVDSAGETAQTLSFLAPGSSPAITGLSGGGFEMAFVASDGTLWEDLNGNGHQVPGVSVAPGSNAAIAANPTGGWEIATARAGDHDLVTVVPGDTVRDTGLTVANDTTPSIGSLFPG